MQSFENIIRFTQIIIVEIKTREWPNNLCARLYIDLSKALDTIEHTKLLQKLNIYGIRGNVHALLKSYLSNRLQYTSVLGENSSKLPRLKTISKMLL